MSFAITEKNSGLSPGQFKPHFLTDRICNADFTYTLQDKTSTSLCFVPIPIWSIFCQPELLCSAQTLKTFFCMLGRQSFIMYCELWRLVKFFILRPSYGLGWINYKVPMWNYDYCAIGKELLKGDLTEWLRDTQRGCSVPWKEGNWVDTKGSRRGFDSTLRPPIQLVTFPLYSPSMVNTTKVSKNRKLLRLTLEILPGVLNT